MKGDAVQNAKDTFYEALRARLAALNPERTVVVRGVTRPGLLVEENELSAPNGAASLPDCFLMRWTALTVEPNGALPMVTMRCEIAYATAGSSWNGGMDRGRLLAAMDGELSTALCAMPSNILKQNYTAFEALPGGVPGSAVPLSSHIWWGAPAFAAAKADRDRIGRVATVDVMSYQEGGEL